MRSISSEQLHSLGNDALSDLQPAIANARERSRKAQQQLRSIRTCLEDAQGQNSGVFSSEIDPDDREDLNDLRNLLQSELEWLDSRKNISAEFDEEWETVKNQFKELQSCSRIWDLTREDVGKQYRSLATRGVHRSGTSLRQTTLSKLSRTEQACRFTNENGPDLWLLPRLLVVQSSAGDLGIVHLADVSIQFYASRFHEDESVPADAEVVDHTWKYTNNDGSRDRRFNDNYRIPVCLYGIIRFETESGVEEEFMLSDVENVSTFAEALASYLETADDFPISFYEATLNPPPDVAERRSQIATLLPTLRTVSRRRKRKKLLQYGGAAIIAVALFVAGAFGGRLFQEDTTSRTTPTAPPLISVDPDRTVGDSSEYSVTVIANGGKLSPLRATVDDGIRRPYWIEKGDAITFYWTEKLVLEGDLGVTSIGLNNYLYRSPTESASSLSVSDSSAALFLHALPNHESSNTDR